MVATRYRFLLLPLPRRVVVGPSPAKFFLYVHTTSGGPSERKPDDDGFCGGHANPSPMTSSESQGLVSRWVARALAFGEHKWHVYSQMPPDSIRGRVYRAGNGLLQRIPAYESMLWRAYHLIERKPPPAQSGDGGKAQLMVADERREFYVETSTRLVSDAEKTLRQLRDQMHLAAVTHRKWWLTHTLLVVPVTILTVLPGVKLVLAWIVFRLVTHYRAFRASQWLLQLLADRRIALVPNPTLDRLDRDDTERRDGDDTTARKELAERLARDLRLPELASLLPRVLQSSRPALLRPPEPMAAPSTASSPTATGNPVQ